MAYKAKCSGSSSSQRQKPGLESLTWVSELLLLWENLCNIIPPTCGSSTQVSHVISIYCQSTSPTSLIWFLLCVFGCRRPFLVGPIFVIDGCSADSCNFGVLMRGGELRVFFIVPLWPLFLLYFLSCWVITLEQHEAKWEGLEREAWALGLSRHWVKLMTLGKLLQFIPQFNFKKYWCLPCRIVRLYPNMCVHIIMYVLSIWHYLIVFHTKYPKKDFKHELNSDFKSFMICQ